MGLDQYLNAKKFVSPAEWRGEESKQQFDTIVKTVKADTFVRKEFPNAEVSISVGYWRKANQIHNWFVQNCQDGKDDCREYIVEREQLETLKSLCQTVIMDKASAEQMLPTRSGDFFGSTEYNEYYYSDLVETINIINTCLEMPVEWSFCYQSSW